MTLMDAQPPDFARERRRRITITIIIAVVLIAAALAWELRYWPEEHVADKFFSALERQDYEAAYGIYFAAPNWKQHPQRYSLYAFSDFYRDWGPSGEWGIIKSYKIEVAGTCPGGNKGVVVQVIVNGRADRARIWVQKSDKTISYPPC
ncbi:MAG TPA: hypothetical protein VJX16_07140 [Terriglobales bacterium]|nr:hypothetical protein [Terriglobales bacterium]